jgi:hypothetical protein
MITVNMIFIYQSAKTVKNANYKFSWKKVGGDREEC